MTTINDIPGDTPAQQRDWLFKQWSGVSDMLNRAIAQLSPHPRLKLFVWEDVLCDHSCGIAFGLAHDSEEARQMILAKLGYEHADLSRAPLVFDPTGDPVAFYSYGGG